MITQGQQFGTFVTIDRINLNKGRDDYEYWISECTECGLRTTLKLSDAQLFSIPECKCCKNHKPQNRLENLTGKKFGKLTVLSFDCIRETANGSRHRLWNVRCECGNIRTIEASQLKSGKTRSCGCIKGISHIVDLTGKRFNMLTVLSFNCLKNRKSMWNVKCDCGTIKILSSNQLHDYATKSCGCIKGKSSIIDLVGKRFGKLTVMSIDVDYTKTHKIRWIVKCDCGNIKSIGGSELRSGKTISCGCSKKERGIIKDITGKKFGKLTVLSFSHTYKNKSFWNTKCDCGNLKTVIRSQLVTGRTKSCGCLRKPKIITNNVDT